MTFAHDGRTLELSWGEPASKDLERVASTTVDAEGDYPEVVWQYADAINGKSDVPGGKLGLTVDGTYKDAFGC